MTLLVEIPWARRVWALPFLSALAPSRRYCHEQGIRHKPITELAGQLLLLIRRWQPGKEIIAIGDGGYACLKLLDRCRKLSERSPSSRGSGWTLASMNRLHLANLTEPPVAVEADPKTYLKDRERRLHEELCKVGRLLPRGRLEGVRLGNGKVKVIRPKREQTRGMKEFRRRIYSFLPRMRLTDLIVEVDSWTGFSEHLTHLTSGEPCTSRELVYAGVLADGTNLGLTKMAEATEDPGTTYERLA